MDITLINTILSDVYSGATSLISTNVGQFILLGVGLVIGFALVRFGLKWIKKGLLGDLDMSDPNTRRAIRKYYNGDNEY